MNKEQLRKIYLAKRKTLRRGERVAKNQAITDGFLKLFQNTKSSTLHVFLPILKNNEIDTWPIIHDIWENFINTTIVTSVTDFETKTMHNYQLKPTTQLVTNRWGISEPSEAEPIDNQAIDWVIVPLLCFDNQGFRIGYGGGFYDRFLQNCRPDIKKTGVSWFPPVQNILDIDAYDVPLDDCITPAGIYTFNEGKIQLN
ncbi:5-formyltetrahydrofolate cyclo-ligase [marine bacterium AO1-C]|nr:5-formyltetrahydrofolate cyclo-ligase [marine bacterium AO1-C]